VKWALDTLKVEACKDEETKAFGSPRVELRAFPVLGAALSSGRDVRWRHAACGAGKNRYTVFFFILDFCLQSSCEVK
jgi:hypothetical protein